MKKPADSTAPGMAGDAGGAAARVMQRCQALAACSEEPGRITRTFLREAARDAHALVRGWMEAAGMTVRLDGVGNIIGRLETSGHLDAKGALVIGSHLDTVPNAGKYDGILGVMAGIALAEMLHGQPLPFALEVVGFSEEEGVRFAKPYIGSRGFISKLDPTWLDLKDKAGITLAEAIRTFGLAPNSTAAGKMRGYLELHIEQGPILDEMDTPVGVVTAIAGQTRIMLRFTGKAGHAGTVPMGMRRDALAGTAEVVLAVEKIAREIKGLVATVGKISVEPNGTNVIPGSVDFSLDIRHADDITRKKAVEEIELLIQEITTRRHLGMDILTHADFAAVKMHAAMTKTLRDAIRAEEGEVLELVSGAGHDAAVMAECCPTAMLFVRNPGGISHHPEEAVAETDVAEALRVMYSFVLRMAQEANL